MTTHTPGPWFVESDDKTPIYVSPVGRHENISICNVMVIDEDPSESGDWINGSQTKANARLIAAAPELLAALESLVLFTNPKPSNAAALNRAHQVISKARGEA